MAYSGREFDDLSPHEQKMAVARSRLAFLPLVNNFYGTVLLGYSHGYFFLLPVR